MEEVDIIVDGDGNITIEANGFEGPACEEIVEDLAAAAGTVTERKHKPEYHRTRTKARKVAR